MQEEEEQEEEGGRGVIMSMQEIKRLIIKIAKQ